MLNNKLSTYFIAFCIVCIILFLNACGKCDITNTQSKFNLTLSAPNEYPAGIAATMPIVITNNDDALLSNLSYSITNNTTGIDLSITSASASNCATLAAGQSCTLSIAIPATSQPGSFTVLTSVSSSSKSNKLLSNTSTSVVATANVSVGLTQLPSNTNIGINGINSYYNPVVALPNNNAGATIITFVVTSANAGIFNTIDLLDSNGNSLAYQVLTGNSGNGLTALSQGAVVSLEVTIPSGATQLAFYPALKMNGATIASGSATSPSTITVLRPSTPLQGILSIVPSNFALNESSPNQTITVSNIGNGTASNITPNLPEPMQIDKANSNCKSTLESGNSCVYVVTFAAATSTQAGSSAFIINYNTGTNTSSGTASFTYRGKLAVANLTISSASNPNFNWTSTTAESSTSSIITIMNNGTTAIESFSYQLPIYFATSTTNVTNACNAGMILQPNQFCNIALIYTNATPTPATTQSVVVSYKYLDPITQLVANGSSSIGVTYNTLQSQAILTITPSLFNFGNILNNNTESNLQTFMLSNNGAAATANTPTAALASSGSLYTIINNNCTTILNSSESCSITIKAGPVESNILAGAKTNTLDISYQPSPNANNNILHANLSTQVVTAQTAIINVVQTESSGFAGGYGSLANPYMLESGANASVTYTISNTGLVDATNFALSYSTGALSPWVATGSCTTQTPLAANGGSCSITFSVTANNSNLSLPINDITLSWIDQDSPLGQSQSFANAPVYVNVFAPAQITFSTESINLYRNASTTLVATLSGGYNMQNQTITLTDTTGGALASITSNPSPCTLSSVVTSCIFTITASASAIPGSYSIGASNSGNATLSSSTIIVNILTPQWMFYGAEGFSGFGSTLSVSLAFNPSTDQPYIAYTDGLANLKATVMRYNGNSWVTVGNQGFSAGQANYNSLAFNPITNQPYIAFRDSSKANKITVMMYNNESWVTVGSTGFSAGGIAWVSLAFKPNTSIPYVAYIDGSYAMKAVIMKYENESWGLAGANNNPIASSGANYVSLAFKPNTQQPYIVYKDTSASKATAYMYNGESWVIAGSPQYFSVGNINDPSLAFNPITNQPYVAYSDVANGSKTTVMMLNSSNNWVPAGNIAFSAESAINQSLAFKPNTSTPYVAYRYADYPNNKVTVMMLDGATWSNVGSPAFSNNTCTSTSLAFSTNTNNPQPFVGFNGGGPVSVMYYP